MLVEAEVLAVQLTLFSVLVDVGAEAELEVLVVQLTLFSVLFVGGTVLTGLLLIGLPKIHLKIL